MTSRRAALRAAWAAPVVTLLTAAPAQAVGSAGPPAVLTLVGSFTHSGTNVSFSGTLTVTSGSPTAALQVTFTLTGGSPGYGSTTASAMPGFSAPTKTTSGNNVTFTYTANSQMTNGQSQVLTPSFTIPSGMSNKAGTGTATATATGSTPATTSTNYA